MHHLKQLAIAAALAASAASGAAAAPYTSIYAFGDSLSDVGNVFLATAGTPAAQPLPPYADGQFSNGPVWVQTLAAGLGIAPLRPSLAGGTNYAVGGAESGVTPTHRAGPNDLPAQLGFYLAAHPTAVPGALYTLWIGANDLLDGLQAAGVPGSANPDPATTAAAAAANTRAAARALAATGVRDLLVVSVPDLGDVPLLNANPVASAAATALSAGFNAALFAGLQADPLLAGVSLYTLDAFALGNAAAASPADFGFSNVTAACVEGASAALGAPGTPCAPTRAGQDRFLYWDSIHPTAAAHALIGQAALAAVTAPGPGTAPAAVPEPASLLLLGAGLAGLGAARGVRPARAA